MKPIRVLICDDSALVRSMLGEILNSDPDIEVVGRAADAYAAREKIKQLNPDVLTLDIEMPKMDGISFLRNLMRLRPMPVVMVSSLTRRGATATLEALELGAIDFVAKPATGISESLPGYAEEIIAKVKIAARATARPLPPPKTTADRGGDRPGPGAAHGAHPGGDIELIAVGASTGGTEALRELLSALGPDLPPMLIVQHIPPAFSAAFARRLDGHSRIKVTEAVAGESVRPGHAYVAPGDEHLSALRTGDGYCCHLDGGARVNHHRPSVDALFDSVAIAAGARALGVLMTGMGADGAQGLRKMHRAGAATIAQDEQTCVIWGMPREAIALGCVDHVLPLPEIAGRIREVCSRIRHPRQDVEKIRRRTMTD